MPSDIPLRDDAKNALSSAAILWGALYTVFFVIASVPLFIPPPSPEEHGTVVSNLANFFVSSAKLLTNGNFMILTIVYVLLALVLNILSCNFAPMVYAFGIGIGHALGSLILMIFGGILGIFFHIYWYKKDKAASITFITIASTAIFFLLVMFMFAHS